MDVLTHAMKLLSLLVGLLFTTDVKSTPSPSEWANLAQSFGGKLLTNVRPPAAPCHLASYNAEECATVVAQYLSTPWRSSQIGAMQTQLWEQLDGHWCDIDIDKETGLPTNSTTPIRSACPQGNVPRFAVNATTPGDVLKAVQFAHKFHIPLVIKSTGHDYLGRSSDPNRLLLWTHHMKNITFGSSQICGTNYAETLTLAAGVQWNEAYRAIAPHKRVVPGGADGDVGASGGQVMGGGHSPLSNTYGLTPDSVLQFEVVTLDGVARTVNQCSHPDLFWVLRGGGGGTYAVITSTTFRTYADSPLAFAAFNYSNTPEGFALALDLLANASISLAEMGWSGYFFGNEGSFFGIFFLPLINNLTFDIATASLQPLFAGLDSTKGLTRNTTFVTEYPSVGNYLGGSGPGPGQTTSSGFSAVLGSRLIPKELLRNSTSRKKITNIIASIRNDASGVLIIGHLVAGGASSIPTNSAVLPAWRKALWHIVFTSPLPIDASELEIEKNFQFVTGKLEPLRQATPGSGAYMNEANPRAPEWKEDFFGENYGKLLQIKRKWDQKGLLRCNECVGSE